MNIAKKSFLALAVSASLNATAHAELFISEYVEGSANNKAIEITNRSDQAVNLDDWAIKLANNGNTNYSKSVSLSDVLESGKSLEPGKSLVVAYTKANEPLKGLANSLSSQLNFNGNDVVALTHNEKVVDSLGKLGSNEYFGRDKTLRRKLGTTGREDITSDFDPSVDWESSTKDTFSGLGCDGLAACSDPEPKPVFSCGDENRTPIYEVQGDGASSPLVPAGKYESVEDYYVEGVVTAVTTGLYKGFWLQDPQGDNNDATSDGIFVLSKSVEGLTAGSLVCAAGKVKEFYGFTQLDAKDTQWEFLGDATLPSLTPIRVLENESLTDALERYEGMLVKLDTDSDLVVTRNFGFDYDSKRNNMVLSYQKPLVKPTQLHPAGSLGTDMLAKSNAENRLYVESDQKAPNGKIPYFPELDAEQGYIRIFDRVENLEGVLGFSFREFRLVPTNSVSPADFVHQKDRTDAPTVVDGSNLKVASFNVLNYFTSHSDIGGDLNPMCKDQADADASRGCNRGAKRADEFAMQRDKIVNAMLAIDADILGLMEVENNGFGDKGALADLVNTLNSRIADSDKHYAMVTPETADLKDGKFLGSDAIMVAFIYRPAKVSLAGAASVVRMPEQHIEGENPKGETAQHDKYQRDSLLQTFNMPGEQTLSIVVNHLKSKGSGCYEDWVAGEFESDPADLQGRCNEFRVSATETLGKALQDLSGDVLALGDFNAYAQEDPMRVLTNYDATNEERKIVTAAGTSIQGKVMDEVAREVGDGFGYTNLATAFAGEEAFSYSFDGELGSLDHALGNNSLKEKVVAVEDWHINSVESTLFEYPSRYTGDLVKSDNAFSSSDHDPVIISLNYESDDGNDDGNDDGSDDG
ncbi:ExeM/NucH family extracellular endonuclease, partial [Veronia pacifica]